jgi:hypothetical protein
MIFQNSDYAPEDEEEEKDNYYEDEKAKENYYKEKYGE